jgi:uncharacterized RmlC-like cupin family protein
MEKRMSQKNYFNNVNDENTGITRILGEGISTRIFSGDQAMLSIVTIEPNAKGKSTHIPKNNGDF